MNKRKQLNRKHNKRSAIKLLVESLEPRHVLSAVGFGFNDGLDRFDVEDRERNSRGEFRSEQFGENRDSRGNERFNRRDDRFELANRFSHDRHPERGDDLDRHGHSHHDIDNHRSDRPDFEDRFEEPSDDFGEGEGSYGFYDDFDADEFNSRNEPPSFFEPIAPLRPVVLVTLAPTTSPSTNFLAPLGQAATTAIQSPPGTIAQFFADSSNSAPTLPITVPTSPSTPNQTITPTLSADQSFTSFESTSDQTDNSLAPITDASPAVADSPSAYFVSLTTSADDQLLGLDGAIDASLSSAFSSSITSIATEAMNKTFMNQVISFSDESLWTSLSEGGFIELDNDASERANTAFDFSVDGEDKVTERNGNENAQHNAFWFDFDDSRFDLLMDTTQLDELAAEIDSAAEANDSAGDAWLLDEGGMIVLTTQPGDAEVSQFTQEQGRIEPTTNQGSDEVNVQMHADIGIFQAIEVASSPIELLEAALGDAEATDETSGTVATDDNDLTPPAEQAAADTDRTSNEPTRAAALPWLAALAALLDFRRHKRKPVKNSEFQV